MLLADIGLSAPAGRAIGEQRRLPDLNAVFDTFHVLGLNGMDDKGV